MYAKAEKLKENKSTAVANSFRQKQSNTGNSSVFVDNRSEAIAQRKLNDRINQLIDSRSGTGINVEAPIQGAFWHIDPGEKEVTKEQLETVKRLKKNKQFSDDEDVKGLDQVDNSLSRSDIEKNPTGLSGGKEDLYVMAHGFLTGAGVHKDQPWIGGMEFNDFALQLKNRYGGVVEGKTIWLMACLVGGVLESIAEELVEVGMTNVTILAPDSFMFVSDKGIPHVYSTTDADHEILDRDIAKENADYDKLKWNPNWLKTGLGWAGCTIDDCGNIVQIPKALVIKMVLEKFDINYEEWDDEDTAYDLTFDLLEKEEKIELLETKAKEDFDSLFEIQAFTIDGAEEHKDKLNHKLKKSKIAINNAQGEAIDVEYQKGLIRLQKLFDSVE